LKTTPEGSVDLYQCLATNAITQHKFRLAKEYTEKAIALKDKKSWFVDDFYRCVA
jgi:hypothetical protein